MSRIFGEKRSNPYNIFWRTTQNLLILALLCSLYSKQTFKVHVGVEKRIDTKNFYTYECRYDQ